MISTNWPLYAIFGGTFGMGVALIALPTGLVLKRSWLTLAALGLALISAAAVTASVNSSYWKKPDCYLSDGQLDESREECRFSTTFEDLRESP